MLRVYLDQNKWVDLARARSGHPLGSSFEDVLAMARAAVKARQVSFPLSAGHFFETRHRRDYASRVSLGETMVELSRWHAIAPAHVLVPGEIDHALHRMADRDGPVPSPLRVFGGDVNHALGTDVVTYDLPADLAVPSELRSLLRDEGKQVMQWITLVGVPTDPPALLDYARKEQNIDQRFADGQADLAKRLADHGLNQPSRIDDAMTATELSDILDPLLAAALARGLDPDKLFDRGGEWLTALLRDVPSRWVTREMRRARHKNTQQDWSRTDLNDVNALSVAVPYCDVVVTERQWVHHLKRAGLHERFNTVLISDLRELPVVLVGGG